MPSLPSTSPYHSHTAWLEAQRENYARYVESVSGLTSPSVAASNGLLQPPTSWPGVGLHADEAQGGLSEALDSIALDAVDFDEPVYRSFGNPDFDAFSSGSSSWAASDDFEEPVYRSLSGAMEAAAPAPAAATAALSTEDAERLWLAGQNPPLIRRQHARGATFAL